MKTDVFNDKTRKFLKDYWSAMYPPEYAEAVGNVEFAGMPKKVSEYDMINGIKKALDKMRKEF